MWSFYYVKNDICIHISPSKKYTEKNLGNGKIFSEISRQNVTLILTYVIYMGTDLFYQILFVYLECEINPTV